MVRVDVPFFRQETCDTCAPACLRMALACRFPDRAISEAELARRCRCVRGLGTLVGAVYRAARRYRLAATWLENTHIEAEVEAALTAGYPVLANVQLRVLPYYPSSQLPQAWHSVLIVGIDARYVHLARIQPQVYTPQVAMTLNNLGTVLYDIQEWAAARAAYEEALTLYRHLAYSQPQVYTPNVATTLHNLGNVLRDLREWASARAAYQEAIALRERHSLWLESAETHYSWGLLEEDEGNAEWALELFEACIERCERGLSQLVEREHRDLFKAKIELAYEWLIEHYARLAESDGQATRERLVGLLESLRRGETLAGFGAAASDGTTTWQETFHALMHGTGELAPIFRRTGCAFLWIHATPNSVVFVILTPGHCQVRVAERAVLDKLSALFDTMERAIAAWQQSHPRAPAYEVLSLHATTAHVPPAAAAVYYALPDDVQALLTNDNYKTIFLAPCGATVNLPWELVRVPEKGREGNEEEWTYLGLQRLLPRTHGLGELTEVLQRHPRNEENGIKRPGGRRTRTRGGRGAPAVVVGNPLHTGTPPLPDSRTAAQALAARLRQGGFQLLPNGEALLDAQATSDAVDAALGEQFVLWAQMGHGGWDADGRYLYLALAGNDKLSPQPIARRRWTHHPIVHYDCCVVGTTLAPGGGRFDGHPTAALLAGASCVLSSVHPLFDRYAAAFSDKLYAKALDRQHPLPLGAALLQTRQEMAREYAGNPLVWAMTVLWGNPWVQLGTVSSAGSSKQVQDKP